MSHKKTILIIDDSNTSLILLEWSLQQEHYNTFIAENVANAQKILSKNTPDLILLDLSMPGVSGYDFLKMRNDLELQDVPIIVVSALDNSESIEEAKSLGANEFIAKPFSISNIIGTVNKYLNS